MAIVEGVESVEKFFLGAFFICQEVDIVDHEDIDMAIFFAEGGERFVLDGIDKLIGELFAGEVGDFGIFFVGENGVTDAVEEVCFAQTAGAVDKERVIFAGRSFSDGFGGCVGKFVIGAYDKSSKCIARV